MKQHAHVVSHVPLGIFQRDDEDRANATAKHNWENAEATLDVHRDAEADPSVARVSAVWMCSPRSFVQVRGAIEAELEVDHVAN